MGFLMRISKISFLSIVFVLVAIVLFIYTNDSHAEPGENGSMYYFSGWDYPGCGIVSDSYGHSVEEVARKDIEKQNKITDCKHCLSPAILVSVNEEAGTWVERSACTGAVYTYQVTRLPLPFKPVHNIGPSNQCP